VITSIRRLRVVQITSSSLSRWGHQYGGRYRCADTSPTLTDCLWFLHWLFVGTQRTRNCTRRMLLSHWRVASFLDLASLSLRRCQCDATEPSVARVQSVGAGSVAWCETTTMWEDPTNLNSCNSGLGARQLPASKCLSTRAEECTLLEAITQQRLVKPN
jgi:hypothetical protein